MCKAIADKGYSFIFTCKPQPHPRVSETVKNSYLHEKTRREWNGRHHLVYRYRWLNGVEIRDSRETLKVDYVYFEIENEEKGKITYRNSWVTDKLVNEDNAALIVSCGRARWKIENEHKSDFSPHVLKKHGYNLEHNFGHGEAYASEMFCLLNFLAFLWHGLLWLADEICRQARVNAGRRDEFFNELRGSMRYMLHENWQAFMVFARDGPGE
jgi:hypothetical protein